jgi:hypothetical protein
VFMGNERRVDVETCEGLLFSDQLMSKTTRITLKI